MANNRIARTRTIEGLVTPAFIHNGGYYFINLEVYADGLVNCWDLLDLPLFQAKLRSGWVVTDVPDGKIISIHGLAAWKISEAHWDLDRDALFTRVTELVRELNPRMENLHDCHGRTTEKIGKANVSILGMPKVHAVRAIEPAYARWHIQGDDLSILVRTDRWYLANLRAFADGVIELGRLPVPETLTIAELDLAVANGRIAASVPSGTRIEIDQLGSFVAEELSGGDIREVLREVPDLIDRANGRADSVQRCRVAYDAYVAAPSDPLREALRVAYEGVPEHRRLYVGDMDTKDRPVRAILFGDPE